MERSVRQGCMLALLGLSLLVLASCGAAPLPPRVRILDQISTEHPLSYEFGNTFYYPEPPLDQPSEYKDVPAGTHQLSLFWDNPLFSWPIQDTIPIDLTVEMDHYYTVTVGGSIVYQGNLEDARVSIAIDK